MSTTLDVPLLRGDCDDGVTARLTDAIPIEVARQANTSWSRYITDLKAERVARGETPPAKEHQHWDWEWKMKETAHLLAYSGYAIEFEGDVQGLMLLRTGDKFARVKDQELKPLVYVVFIQTAPWNNSQIVKPARFRGVGSTFLRAAIELSRELEFKGRIGLHSLPQAVSWYERFDIHCLGADKDKGGLKYYEMTPEQADAFVRED